MNLYLAQVSQRSQCRSRQQRGTSRPRYRRRVLCMSRCHLTNVANVHCRKQMLKRTRKYPRSTNLQQMHFEHLRRVACPSALWPAVLPPKPNLRNHGGCPSSHQFSLGSQRLPSAQLPPTPAWNEPYILKGLPKAAAGLRLSKSITS